jgi:ankyrin repeat protein
MAADTDPDAVSRLHRAVIAGDESLVQQLLGQDEDLVEARDAAGRTALHIAAEHARLVLIPLLLDHGADIDALDASGRTVLHHAVSRNNLALSTLLLEHGANVEATTSDGEKPLWIAASRGHESVAESLLQCEADVEAFNPKSGTTALFEAVNRGDAGLVKLLLDNGADIDSRRHGSGPQGARKDGASDTEPEPQRQPAHHRRSEKIHLVPVHNEHVLHRRRRTPSKGLLHYLAGPDPRMKKRTTKRWYRVEAAYRRPGGPFSPPPSAWIPGHMPTSYQHDPAGSDVWWEEPVRRAYSPPLPPQDPAPGTVPPRTDQLPPEADREVPLHRAVLSGNADMVKLLLQHGADIGIRGKDGRSAQQVAEEQGMRELAALLQSGLLLEGPDITQQDKGKRPQGMPPPLVPRALPPPRHNAAKMAACRCFEATMVEFYTEGREQRYQQSAPVYEVLYGKGPKAILDAGRPVTVAGKTPKFTWYHLPANNVGVLTCIHPREAFA